MIDKKVKSLICEVLKVNPEMSFRVKQKKFTLKNNLMENASFLISVNSTRGTPSDKADDE